jgi:hypothetical protein
VLGLNYEKRVGEKKKKVGLSYAQFKLVIPV